MPVILLIVLVLCAVSATRAEELSPAGPLTLANGRVQFQFEPQNMGLSGMIDVSSGVNHIQSQEGKQLLWEVALARGRQVQRITNNYKPCNYASLDRLSDGTQRLVLEWNDLRWWLEDNVVTVRVSIELGAESGIGRWRIFVENQSDYWGLWSVSFPLVNGFPAKDEYDIARPTFGSGGHLLKKCSRQVFGEYPSGGWPMQFMSLNQGDNGVYFGSMDPDGRGKEFRVIPGATLSLVHYPENMGVAGSDLPDYYAVEMGVFQGNWVKAAHHYRSWALRQKWARRGRVSQRTDIPSSIKNVGLWVTEGWIWHPKPDHQPSGRKYITASGAHEAPAESNDAFLSAQRLMGVPMAMHWYHWHHNKFNHEFPHFLPAREGVKERVKELVDSGWLVMPYINGYSTDMDIPDFADFAPHASLDDGGGYRLGFYGDSAGRLLAMCPTHFWQGRISSLVDRMYESYRFNAVYLDQISAAGYDLCFDPKHGHPLGGGRYWTDGFRDLLEKVRNVARMKGRQVVMTSEGADEVFLDLLDANLTWAQPTDWEIPLMQVVYSGYTLFYGSPCDYNRSERFFRYAQGQALMDGRQNGWMDIGLFKPGHERKVEFLRTCARYRVAAGKFLTYGELLQPVKPEKAAPTFEEDGFGWGVRHRGSVPSAEGRLWRSEDGHLGLIMVNYTDDAVPFEFSLDPAEYGLKGQRFLLSELTPEGVKPLGRAAGVISRREMLRPASVRLLEIAPE